MDFRGLYPNVLFQVCFVLNVFISAGNKYVNKFSSWNILHLFFVSIRWCPMSIIAVQSNNYSTVGQPISFSTLHWQILIIRTAGFQDYQNNRIAELHDYWSSEKMELYPNIYQAASHFKNIVTTFCCCSIYCCSITSDSLNVFLDNWGTTTFHGTEFITNVFINCCCSSV